MEENRKEQLEAVEVLAGFQDKFIANTEILIEELKGSRKDDTDKLLKSVTDSVNWEMGVLNGTLSLINEKKALLNKDEINKAVIALSEALKSQDDKKIASALEHDLLPMLRNVKVAAEQVDKK